MKKKVWRAVLAVFVLAALASAYAARYRQVNRELQGAPVVEKFRAEVAPDRIHPQFPPGVVGDFKFREIEPGEAETPDFERCTV